VRWKGTRHEEKHIMTEPAPTETRVTDALAEAVASAH
jgi:hypothetical protein